MTRGEGFGVTEVDTLGFCGIKHQSNEKFLRNFGRWNFQQVPFHFPASNVQVWVLKTSDNLLTIGVEEVDMNVFVGGLGCSVARGENLDCD
ncbi:hypothetical protein ES705_48749 [subsurface metagenome]